MTDSVVRRLASAIVDDTKQIPLIRFINTTVTAVSAGTSLDGRAEVSIAMNSDTPIVPYLAAYVNGHTATVGDTVSVLVIDGSPIILDRLFGQPNL